MSFWRKAFHLLNESARECRPLAILATLLNFILGIAEYLLVAVIIFSVFNALQTGKIENLLTTALVCAGVAIGYLVICYLQNVYLDLNWSRINTFGERRAVKRLHQMNTLDPIRSATEESLLNTARQGASALSIFFSTFSRISSAIVVLILLIIYSVNRSLTILAILLIVLTLTFTGLILTQRILRHSEPLRQQALTSCEKSAGLATSGIVLRCFGKDAVKQEINRYKTDRNKLLDTTWKQEWKLSITRSLQDSLSLLLKGSLPRWFYSDYANNQISYDEVATTINSYEQVRNAISRQVFPYQQAVRSKIALSALEQWYQNSNKEQRQDCECIDVSSLSFEIDGRMLLNQVDFTLNKGEHVALIGSNGSGKTTLLRCLMGFLKPQNGQILYQGNALQGLSYEQRRGLFTWIPNQAMLFSGSVEMNIQINQDQTENADLSKLMQDFGLNKDKSESISRFSDGEQQRVNILRGLVHQANWLIADEPTARLQQSLSFDAMKQILDKNESCFIVTHEKEHLKLFDRVLVMQGGKLIFDGSASEYCLKNNIN